MNAPIIKSGEFIGYFDSSGIDHINAIHKRSSDKHIKYLNRKVTLPILHAATMHNIRNAEGRRPLAAWSPGYRKFRLSAIPKKDTVNRQPTRLGKQEPRVSNKILIFTGKLFHNLGTRIRVSSKSVFYGVNTSGDRDYIEDVINGRASKNMVVTVPRHTRKSFSRNGKAVRATEVKEHKKSIKAGKLPKRNIFYLMPRDTTTIEKAYIQYLIAPPKVRSIRVSTTLPITVSKDIPILS